MIPTDSPALLLAPMQDITDLPFLRTIAKYGGADLYVTEYFRVHIHSNLDPYILRSITENPTEKPVIAQMIGQDAPELVRTAQELSKYPIAGIDLNLGCPAPVVYRKNAGGGLLRKPEHVDHLLGQLRDTCADLPFTIKTRLGFESPDEFSHLLTIFKKHAIDLLTIHGRTVKERYQTPVHVERVREAVQQMPCPVIANGNVVNAQTGQAYLQATGAAGLMIGRGAIRNPWIFDQLRAQFTNKAPPLITGKMLFDYIQTLYHEIARETKNYVERKHVHKMKKYLNYIVQGHHEDFDHQIRRVKTKDDFFTICQQYLNHNETISDLPPENSRLFCGFSQFL